MKWPKKQPRPLFTAGQDKVDKDSAQPSAVSETSAPAAADDASTPPAT